MSRGDSHGAENVAALTVSACSLLAAARASSRRRAGWRSSPTTPPISGRSRARARRRPTPSWPTSTVEFRLGDGTAAEQKRIVDDLLAKGVDGIAISPVDPANQTAMLNDAAQKAARLHARQRRARTASASATSAPTTSRPAARRAS